jgi:hypothetical protein
MNPKQLLGFFFTVLFSFSAPAEPLNILVGELTFTRPSDWKWEPPDPKSPAITGFVIPNNETKKVGDVRFYLTVRDPESAVTLWKEYFSKEDQGSLQTRVVTIGKRTITYFSLHGMLTLPKDKPEAAQGFVGVVIPNGDKYLHIRVTGPENLVDKSMPALKAMVEAAVDDRESELDR